jgi:hypothetical protein
MAAESFSSADGGERNRFVLERWQAYDAESRANVLRIIAIGVFYLAHLWSYFSAQGKVPNYGFFQVADAGEIGKRFHIEITLLAVTWTILALGVLLSLQQRIFPSWLPYLTTSCDMILLSLVLCISNGPRSPLVAGYFLILVLAALRLSLPLMRFATATTALAYLVLLGCNKWLPLADSLRDAQRVPRYHQIIVLAAIVLAGIMLGQIIRTAWRLIEHSSSSDGPK